MSVPQETLPTSPPPPPPSPPPAAAAVAATTPTPKPKSIAILTCSTRPGRINPAIAAHVKALMETHLTTTTTTTTTTSPSTPQITLATIDFTDPPVLNLPFFNEPIIPGHLPASDPTPAYHHAHTRAWSTAVRQHDAFVFVTPQYNWSMPAVLKNALDFLFWEWVCKPGAVVSYGGHGGARCRTQLEAVLQGLRMRVVDGVEVTVRKGDGVGLAGGVVGEEVRARWEGEGVDAGVVRVVGEVCGLLGEGEAV